MISVFNIKYSTVFFVVNIGYLNMDLSKQLIKVLIQMYRERDFLWRVNSEEYRKKDLRMKGYQEIVNYLKSQGISEATDSLVRDKIQNMRRSVRKERSKIESFAGYVTNLWYYDLLKYVIDQGEKVTTKSKTKTIKREIEDSDTDHSSNDPLYDGPLRAEDHSQEDLDDRLTKAQSKFEQTRQAEMTYVRNPDEFEALGISIAAKVRRMDTTQKIYAELLIQKVMARGLLGTLNDTTELSDMGNTDQQM